MRALILITCIAVALPSCATSTKPAPEDYPTAAAYQEALADWQWRERLRQQAGSALDSIAENPGWGTLANELLGIGAVLLGGGATALGTKHVLRKRREKREQAG